MNKHVFADRLVESTGAVGQNTQTSPSPNSGHEGYAAGPLEQIWFDEFDVLLQYAVEVEIQRSILATVDVDSYYLLSTNCKVSKQKKSISGGMTNVRREWLDRDTLEVFNFFHHSRNLD